MDYITRYYKNLSEQLQNQVKILSSELNFYSKNYYQLNEKNNEDDNIPEYDVNSPKYDYNKKDYSRAWEISDIDNFVKQDVANRYKQYINLPDTESGFLASQGSYRTGLESMPRKMFTSNGYKTYNTKEDAPNPLDTLTMLGAIKNRGINLANTRSEAEDEIKNLKGNMDYTIPAVYKAEKNITGERPISATNTIFDRMREGEYNRRKKLGLPVQ
jgi:hypothetical protein